MTEIVDTKVPDPRPPMYVPHQKDVLVVASLGGAPKNPAWYGNDDVSYFATWGPRVNQRGRQTGRLAVNLPVLPSPCSLLLAPGVRRYSLTRILHGALRR
ncbi:MAG TPA: hypothetical protein DEP35_13735 [Deltaproteobacteria bacterium]|nr:hypothetical protein [Deltaproteobacteria bacterium]